MWAVRIAHRLTRQNPPRARQVNPLVQANIPPFTSAHPRNTILQRRADLEWRSGAAKAVPSRPKEPRTSTSARVSLGKSNNTLHISACGALPKIGQPSRAVQHWPPTLAAMPPFFHERLELRTRFGRKLANRKAAAHFVEQHT